jgi:hypothetical protein
VRKDIETQEQPRALVDLLGSLIIIPILLIGAIVSFPVGFVMNSLWRWKERRFMRRMAKGHRLIECSEFVQEIDQNRGTVVIERISMKGRTLWWWTPDDIYVKSPYPIEGASSVYPDPEFHAFYKWCYETYTHPTTGSGRLVSCTPEQRRSFKDKVRSGHVVTTWWRQVTRMRTFQE